MAYRHFSKTQEVSHALHCLFVKRSQGNGIFRKTCFGTDVPVFDEYLIESYKCVIRQAALFEFRVFSGRLLVCGFRFFDSDPAARWLKNSLITYSQSDKFDPVHTLDEKQLDHLIHGKVIITAGNTNRAFNPNDKAARRKTK